MPITGGVSSAMPFKRVSSNAAQALRSARVLDNQIAEPFGGSMPMMKMITIERTESRANTVYQKRPMFHGPTVDHLGGRRQTGPARWG